MKKSIIVNICGIIFHIDEDAYEILNHYLETLKNYFVPRKDGNEIINDIESRIAELLQPKINSSKQSITIEDIQEIIAILGKPEDITNSDSETEDKTSGSNTDAEPKVYQRRLYRDMENKRIAGVAAGMSAYFNIDPIIFRLIFVALIFASGIGILLYIIFWFALPVAITTTQRLEMKGKNITLSNIEQNIREENSFRRENAWDKIGNFINEFVHAIGTIILAFLKVFKYIFAVLFILIALGIIIGANAGLFFSSFAISNGFVSNIGSLQEFLGYFLLPSNRDALMLLAILIVLIPCAALIYWGLKILIRFRANDKWVSVSMIVIWVIAVSAFTTLALTEAGRYKSESITREQIEIAPITNKCLVIQAQNADNKINEFSGEHFNHSLFGVETLNNNHNLFSPIQIEFEKTNDSKVSIEFVKQANASDYQEAKNAVKRITINWSQKDSVILLEPFFHLNNTDKWNFQRVKLIFKIPENTAVKFDRTTELFINNWLYNDNFNDEPWQYRWYVTSRGLELKK